MKYSMFASVSLGLVMMLITTGAQASLCMSKADLENNALNNLQPVFSDRAARLINVSLSVDHVSRCLSEDAKPTFSISDHGVIFAKMWLNMALANGEMVRYQAELAFETKVWRAKKSHPANAVVLGNDVIPEWQRSNRLVLNDTLFDSSAGRYRTLRAIRKNQIISSSDVTPLRLVEAGQDVLAKYQAGSIMLEVKARALSAGNLYDTITLLPDNQKEPVKGIIQNGMVVYVQK